MSEIQQTMRPNPSDYGIDGGDPEIDQALRISSRWDSSWTAASADLKTEVAVPPEERGKQRIVRRKN
jgi:hypothetical protein